MVELYNDFFLNEQLFQFAGGEGVEILGDRRNKTNDRTFVGKKKLQIANK